MSQAVQPMEVERAEAVLLAVMIGDALGAPVESMSAAEIAAATNGKGVQGFVAPIQTRIRDTRHLQPGQTTDDWQLTAAVAEALVEAGGFELESMAKAHVAAARTPGRIGWGGTTERSVAELGQWFDSHGKEGRSPHTPVGAPEPGLGAGNGVAMKSAPLAVWHAARRSSSQEIWADVRALALMTHAAPAAAWCALAHVLLCVRLLGLPARALSVEQAKYELEQVEKKIYRLSLHDELEAETTLAQLTRTRHLVPDQQALLEEITPGFSALASVPFALGMWASFPRSFMLPVLACVNAGGDSDSTAAMCGALCAASMGMDLIPSQWRSFRPEYAQAEQLARQLVETARAQTVAS